ncbi:2-oxo-4-hydroxy-4-carboxy-5-ureidoimidazoline decarboxylase [Prescottella equi]|uniref:2-oxo-4-hydroxy-4-carboxy-5-ureidoimidazoline decarboxylase n=1 Tax=Rhodococcus hoagii TaxID=43767 RepID=A0AAE5MGZ8_RHOHA|nr:2-oxo-4-hydroxy-4-carboxy-5-ureidoimidazoline decarboxylase [Prescottella equi]MBU4617108.1 2-oxo-4-hydroxy-4-carboxy-5-ureidoimidazoline decarboxylase [Rhodococcus sp. GG48]ERN47305.1 OHCU decarboxylase [Prescottella equi NBRC 101255 = C 7]MBM4627012.1 2-oxo-4-hydroxy-4-carboxy-5-ureidoimidazoline decarboxylase [Prescottella equi]ORL08983.1 2-oxo-4-hydroxy-4-carboxy-5-ureidoimidazoline decarboxylase [Prescottella equi]ORL24685.1 2-oxo-4-hydroxy-4-carboxy-5-ureidoimidazoline decarboxylase [
MLMHQGIGLDRFNELPRRRAVHALFECCCCLSWSTRIADGREYRTYTELLAAADAELHALPEPEIEQALQGHPRIGSRARSRPSFREQCAVWVEDAAVMHTLEDAAAAYEELFGFRYVWFSDGRDGRALLADLTARMTHDVDTERKVRTTELARITRTRLERMLGPEGGFPDY